jgi:hypothetical protein
MDRSNFSACLLSTHAEEFLDALLAQQNVTD